MDETKFTLNLGDLDARATDLSEEEADQLMGGFGQHNDAVHVKRGRRAVRNRPRKPAAGQVRKRGSRRAKRKAKG